MGIGRKFALCDAEHSMNGGCVPCGGKNVDLSAVALDCLWTRCVCMCVAGLSQALSLCWPYLMRDDIKPNFLPDFTLARLIFRAKRGKCAAHTEGVQVLEEQSYSLFILTLNHSPAAGKGQCEGLICWDRWLLPAFERAERASDSYRRPIALHKIPLMLWNLLVLVMVLISALGGRLNFHMGLEYFLRKNKDFSAPVSLLQILIEKRDNGSPSVSVSKSRVKEDRFSLLVVLDLPCIVILPVVQCVSLQYLL